MKIPLEKLPEKSYKSVFHLIKGDVILDDFDIVWFVEETPSRTERTKSGKVPVKVTSAVTKFDGGVTVLKSAGSEVFLDFVEGAHLATYTSLEIIEALGR